MNNAYGDDWDYADTRLATTVVRHAYKPFLVNRVDAGGVVRGQYLDEKLPRTTHVPLDQLQLTPVSLGFVNTEEGACYVVRIPKRNDWRQGLRRGTMRSLTCKPTEAISLRDLSDTIKGIYPTIEACRNIVPHTGTVAWCRNFCITNDGGIMYKNLGIVGRFAGAEFRLSDEFSYLQEALEDSL